MRCCGRPRSTAGSNGWASGSSGDARVRSARAPSSTRRANRLSVRAVLARGAVHVLSRVLDSSMHGLEWSSGSSTRFYLQRLGSLVSIEQRRVGARDRDADPRGAPTVAPRKLGLYSGQCHDHQLRASRAPHAQFDFVAVDGTLRARCLRRVEEERLVFYRIALHGMIWYGNALYCMVWYVIA